MPDYIDIKLLNRAVSHRVAGEDHWSLKLLDMRVGSYSIHPQARFALTDTGTSLIYLDGGDYHNLIEGICQDQLGCFESPHEADVYAIKNCVPSQLPTIWIQIDLHDYKLAPQAYILSLVYPDESHDCLI